MILFVFEGEKAEPMVFDSLKKLFLTGEEVRMVLCKHDLPTLYANLKKNEYDLFRSLPLKENGIDIPDGVRTDTLFSQIFLFFDYDFQNRRGLVFVNDVLSEMLEFFDDETGNGKLYVNYPMIESLKYTHDLPDNNYFSYTTTIMRCKQHLFKADAETFAYAKAKQYRFIDLSKTSNEEVRAAWILLKSQNVCKANFIVSGMNIMPENKEDVNQKTIFAEQLKKYITKDESVAILNSFPIFLYDYLK